MLHPSILISLILFAAFVLFIRGPWRYDVVALMALFTGVLVGVVPSDEAFLGFGHPATVTVAAVLVISRALTNTGAADVFIHLVRPFTGRTDTHVGSLSAVVALLSAVMNNVGALAMMMPGAVESAIKAKRSPAAILMPLAFASLLGGLVTLIGTPPNIIIAAYREEVIGIPFAMFDFTPVGGLVAIVGILFVALVGWRLIPKARRKQNSPADLFNIEEYVAEMSVPEGASVIGMNIRQIELDMPDRTVVVVGLVRGDRRILGRSRYEPIKADDHLIIEANPKEFDKFIARYGVVIVGSDGHHGKTSHEDGVDHPPSHKVDLLRSDDVHLLEAVITQNSVLVGRQALEFGFRRRFNIGLLAVSRQGRPHRDRLGAIRFQVGDVLLLQGGADGLPQTAAALGLLPLMERGWQMGKRHHALLSVGVFAVAIALTAAGFLTAPIAFGTAAAAMVVLRIVPVRELYDAIDWPVIVLLGAMIPVGGAMETTGLAQILADSILVLGQGVSPVLVLAVLMVVTMALSSVINNAATAVIMAPIGFDMAGALGFSPDPFLMAVAIGASCAFLTPIGHQNNALIMGPGGYAFGDYWRLGLPLEILIVLVSVPAILWIWPF